MESILKVVWIVNHQNKFMTRLHSCIILAIFLDIKLEACSFTKNEHLNRYFSSILSAILPGNCKSYFQEHIFFPKHFQWVHFLFSCSMIQKLIRELIKLETAYYLHGRCYYLHTYSQLGTLKRSEIKLSI